MTRLLTLALLCAGVSGAAAAPPDLCLWLSESRPPLVCLPTGG